MTLRSRDFVGTPNELGECPISYAIGSLRITLAVCDQPGFIVAFFFERVFIRVDRVSSAVQLTLVISATEKSALADCR